MPTFHSMAIVLTEGSWGFVEWNWMIKKIPSNQLIYSDADANDQIYIYWNILV